MAQNDKQKRSNNFNFIIITLIFFIGLGIFQFFMYRNLSPNFQVLSREVIFDIHEDLMVDFSTKVNIRTEKENDFNTLLSGFNTPDEEKAQLFQDTLDKLKEQIPRDFVVISYVSTINSNFPNIIVDETVTLKGFVVEKEDGVIEFSLPNQLLSAENERVDVTIHYPDSWEVVSVNPNPTYIEQNVIGYSHTGSLNYPTIQFYKN